MERGQSRRRSLEDTAKEGIRCRKTSRSLPEGIFLATGTQEGWTCPFLKEQRQLLTGLEQP